MFFRQKSRECRHFRRQRLNEASYQLLESRQVLSTFQIIAAGVTNQEQINLQIDGQVVQTWNNLGGNAYAGQYVQLDYSTGNTILANRVRIGFTNDLYDPANNVDRNVRVDAILIDGVRYETESPTVYSTGTWTANEGIVPGFRNSEYLHSDGYFQYEAGGGNSGSLIRFRVSGDEGGEQFQILINGSVVANHTVTTAFQIFDYRAAGVVSPNQVQIAFVNDLWDPGAEIDRNLNVDYLSIDGTIYQTEAANVWSTGTWRSQDGIVPGFRQSEALHTNGYFQYGQLAQAGNIQLQSSVVNVAESVGSAQVVVTRTNGSDGTATVDYRTVATSATSGSDFQPQQGTLTFLSGETSKTINIPIINDSAVEPDEQFAVTIDNVTGGATLLAPRTATITIRDNDSIQARGEGLLGEYFNQLSFSNRFLHRIDSTVNFLWDVGSPANGMSVDNFMVRWTGEIEPRFSETYTFHTRTDDGVRLWVNNQLIIDKWVDQAATEHTGTIVLEAGVLTSIRMEYYEKSQVATAQLFWSSPSQSFEIIPRSQLYPANPPPITPGDSLQNQPLITGLVAPTAIDFSSDGSRMYIAEQRGIVRVVSNGVLQATPFLDFRDRVNGTRDRGLLDIAIHPDFANNPYVYLLYTYDPPEVNAYASGTLQGPDGNGNRAGRLTRVTANAASGYLTIIPNSEVVLVGGNSTWANFNGFVNSTVNFSEPPAGVFSNGTNLQDFIATDSESHTVGSIEFGADGMLFVSIGDGTSYNQVDPRTSRVQDINNLSGKILRVDPITGRGLSSNPFYNGDPNANRSKVWQSGLRNPFRTAVQPSTGSLFIGDVGWTQWEEINAAAAGANYGWPWYEGGSGNSLRTGGYRDLPAAQTFYASGQAVTASVYALNHAATGINAIVLGDFYNGSTFPASYRGDLFFNDLGQGIVRNINFNTNGTVASIDTFATGAQYVVQMKQGRDGNLYYVDLDNGTVGRWVFLNTVQATATAEVAVSAPFIGPVYGDSQGTGVTVAVIDSGIMSNHPSLQGKLWSNTDEVPGDLVDNDGNGYIDDTNGFNFVDGNGNISDVYGHGTFLSGLIAGESTTNGFRGLAPGARIMPLRVLNNAGLGETQGIVDAIYYAVKNGASVIQLAIDAPQDPSIELAIKYAAQQNVLIVVAAGNGGGVVPSWLASLSARMQNVVSAGGLAIDGTLLPESNRVGDSNAIQLDSMGVASGPSLDGSFATWRGTSVATAHLAAAAALVRSTYPQLSARQVRELLVASASATSPGSDSNGKVDLAKAEWLAEQLKQIRIVSSGNQLNITTTSGSDVVRYSRSEETVQINGVSWNIPNAALFDVLAISGGDGSDRLTITGTSENETGEMRTSLTRFGTTTRYVDGIDFEHVTIFGGSGSDYIKIFDTSGDDILFAEQGATHLIGSVESRSVYQFKNVISYASSGFDRVHFKGTESSDRIVGATQYSRLVIGDRVSQANQFDLVEADLLGGTDSTVFNGGNDDDTLILNPSSGRFHGNGFDVRFTSTEKTTSHASLGNDTFVYNDSDSTDIVNSIPLNTFVTSSGYEHRALGFERTTLRSSVGADRVTLRGTT